MTQLYVHQMPWLTSTGAYVNGYHWASFDSNPTWQIWNNTLQSRASKLLHLIWACTNIYLSIYLPVYVTHTSHLRTNDPWFLFRFWLIIILFIRLFKVFLICLISLIITTWRVFFKVEFSFLFRFFVGFKLFFNLWWWTVNIIFVTDLTRFSFLIANIRRNQITVARWLVNWRNSMK